LVTFYFLGNKKRCTLETRTSCFGQQKPSFWSKKKAFGQQLATIGQQQKKRLLGNVFHVAQFTQPLLYGVKQVNNKLANLVINLQVKIVC
jgi:hypothetical protein